MKMPTPDPRTQLWQMVFEACLKLFKGLLKYF